MPSVFTSLFRRRDTAASTATDDSTDKDSAAPNAADLPSLPKHAPSPSIEVADACAVMAEHILSALDAKYFCITADSAAAVRVARDDYAFFPALEARPDLAPFALGLHRLDVDVALCLRERMVRTICQSLKPGCYTLALTETSSVQVVETMNE